MSAGGRTTPTERRSQVEVTDWPIGMVSSASGLEQSGLEKDSRKPRLRVNWSAKDSQENIEDEKVDAEDTRGNIEEKRPPKTQQAARCLPWEEDLQMLSAFSDKKVSFLNLALELDLN